MKSRLRLGKAEIDRVTLKQALERILELASASPCSYVVTPNSDHIVMLERRVDLQKAYQQAKLVVADGMPLVWASQLLRQALPERVAGSELMPRLCEAAVEKRLRIYLLGGPPGIAERAAEQLSISYPGIIICGCDCPPYGFENQAILIQQILDKLRKAQPNLIFVALGAPKQELWMHQYASQLNMGVMLGIGAALEFTAGTLQRAPLWMQRSGFEWLHRTFQDPWRLSRRYLRDLWIVWIIIREIFRKDAR